MCAIDVLESVRLFRADALVVFPQLQGAADAIVTSPPYVDLREEVASAGPDEYVEWISPFLEALLTVLRPDGGFMLNLGRKFADGVEHSYIERTLIRAEDLGWKRIDTVVWAKINGRPINPYLTQAHEYVYWFTNGDPTKTFRGFDEVRYPYAPETLLRYQRPWTNHVNRKGEESTSVVQEGRTPHPDGARPRSVYVTEVGKEKGIKHPSPMALDFARFLVCLACPPGGTVLDPFFGAGTTGVAARLHSRECIGIELNDEYADEACERLAQGRLSFA